MMVRPRSGTVAPVSTSRASERSTIERRKTRASLSVPPELADVAVGDSLWDVSGREWTVREVHTRRGTP
jgi:hypothetical protein